MLKKYFIFDDPTKVIAESVQKIRNKVQWDFSKKHKKNLHVADFVDDFCHRFYTVQCAAKLLLIFRLVARRIFYTVCKRSLRFDLPQTGQPL